MRCYMWCYMRRYMRRYLCGVTHLYHQRQQQSHLQMLNYSNPLSLAPSTFRCVHCCTTHSRYHSRLHNRGSTTRPGHFQHRSFPAVQVDHHPHLGSHKINLDAFIEAQHVAKRVNSSSIQQVPNHPDLEVLPEFNDSDVTK